MLILLIGIGAISTTANAIIVERMGPGWNSIAPVDPYPDPPDILRQWKQDQLMKQEMEKNDLEIEALRRNRFSMGNSLLNSR